MKIERNIELPKKRVEVPQKVVRHSYAIPSRVLVAKVKELGTGEFDHDGRTLRVHLVCRPGHWRRTRCDGGGSV